MAADNKLAEWAAAFLASYNGASGPGPTGSASGNSATTVPDTQYPGVTPAAAALLRAVDAGGVPAFVTGSLRQIASDNGVMVSEQSTPNEIVEALRSKAQ